MSHDDIEILGEDIGARRVLPLDASRAMAIKRDVRSIDVDASVADLAGALHAALCEPGALFGHIRVLRARDRLGLPFTVGERFQGRYSLSHALDLPRWLARAAPARRALSSVEDRMLSDYAVITHLDLDPRRADGVASFAYEYLEGTPIAGRLTMECRPLGPRSCRVTKATEYQEIDLGALLGFGTRVLTMHNRVFFDEITAAVARLGASITGTDIPGVRVPAPRDRRAAPRAEVIASA